jgi:hypothetical protein
MTYPTFWFSNSGLTLQIILNKLCCYKKQDPSIDYEWDAIDETSYVIQNVQPFYVNNLSTM